MGFTEFCKRVKESCMVCLFDCLLVRITKTTDSVCNPIHFRFIAPSQVQPSTYYSGYILRSTRWRTRQSGELIEIMSSKGIDYKRISGLAKLLADCKTEVRFYATHWVNYAWVVCVVNTSKHVVTKVRFKIG